LGEETAGVVEGATAFAADGGLNVRRPCLARARGRIGGEIAAADARDERIGGRPLDGRERDQRAALGGGLLRAVRAAAITRGPEHCDPVRRSVDVREAEIL